MSVDDPLIDGRPLSTLKVTELKDELDKHGLLTKGNKAVLQERLKEFILGGQKPVVKQESPLVAQYRAQQQKALAEARAADPRNKKIEEEQQVTSTKQTEEPVEKKEVQETGSSDVSFDEPAAEPEPEEKPQASEEAEKDSSSSSSSSSSSGSSSSSRESSPEKVEHEAKDDEEIPEEPKSRSPIPEEPKTVKSQEKTEEQEEAVKEQEVKVESVKLQRTKRESLNDQEDIVGEPEKIKTEQVTEQLKKENVNGEEKESSANKKMNTDENGDELDYEDEDETGKDEATNGDDDEDKKDVEKKDKVREVSNRRATSPSSRHPPSSIVHIRGLVRPFTENNLRAAITSHGGELVDFWIDKVKSHCFAKMTSNENAAKVLAAMNDTHWPETNQKLLSVVHETEDTMTRYKEGRGEAKLPEIVTVGSLTGSSRAERLSTASNSSVVVAGKANLRITVENAVRDNSKRDVEVKERKSLASRLTRIDKSAVSEGSTSDRKRPRSETPPFSRVVDEKKHRLDGERLRRPSEPALKTPDDLFMKTKTLPALYYVPLTEEQVAQKEKRRASSSSNARPSVRDRDRDRNRDRDRRRND